MCTTVCLCVCVCVWMCVCADVCVCVCVCDTKKRCELLLCCYILSTESPVSQADKATTVISSVAHSRLLPSKPSEERKSAGQFMGISPSSATDHSDASRLFKKSEICIIVTL